MTKSTKNTLSIIVMCALALTTVFVVTKSDPFKIATYDLTTGQLKNIPGRHNRSDFVSLNKFDLQNLESTNFSNYFEDNKTFFNKKIHNNIDELVHLLHTEAKVI
jgi:hypothetical protein